MEFDRAEYQRLKNRRLEAENNALKELNTKLIRLLALLLDIAYSGQTIQTKIAVLEIADEMERITDP